MIKDRNLEIEATFSTFQGNETDFHPLDGHIQCTYVSLGQVKCLSRHPEIHPPHNWQSQIQTLNLPLPHQGIFPDTYPCTSGVCAENLHAHRRPIHKYNSSTFARAQGVLRRKVRLDLTEGSCVKHRMGIMRPSSSQPYRSTRRVTISSSLTPCRGLLGWRWVGVGLSDMIKWFLVKGLFLH